MSADPVNPPPRAADSRERIRQFGWGWFETALIVGVFIAACPFAAPEVNEATYLTKARHYWQPEWAAGDLYLESGDAHRVFYVIFGWVTSLVPLPVAAWIGRLVTWLSIAAAWQRLSWALVPRRGMAVLSAGLFVALCERFHMAGEWVIGGCEAKGFAYALVFAALASIVRQRWLLGCLLLGGACALHPIVGLWSFAAAVVAYARPAEDRPPTIALLPVLVVASAIAAAGIQPALEMDANTDPAVRTAAREIYVFQRLPHHLVPSRMDSEHVLRFAGLSLVWLALCFLVTTDKRQRPLRTFVAVSLVIALCGVLIDELLEGSPRWRAELLRLYWFRLSDVMVPVGVALLVTIALVDGLAARRRGAKAALVVCILAVVGHLLEHEGRFRPSVRTPRGERGVVIDDWRAACEWIVENTPPQSRWITPRYQQTFKWHTGREEVANWKDLPQDAQSIVTWWTRLGTLTPDAVHPESGTPRRSNDLGWLGTARLRELGIVYGADYVVARAEPRVALPLLYQNNSYAVYDLAGERSF